VHACSTTDNGTVVRYTLTKAGETLLLAHICVVALIAEPGASLTPTSFELLAQGLSMTLADLQTRFR
jgi:hypothetical protein